MTQYHKIQSLYKRSEDGKRMLFGQYSMEEFEYLKDNVWEFSEKVDGTNIRVIVQDGNITFGGKTDNAQIPAKLVARLEAMFLAEPHKSNLLAKMPEGVLYGEGFGAGIQKVGRNYAPYVNFCLFDVNCGGWWLRRDDVHDIGAALGLQVAPLIANGTLAEMECLVRNGFLSNWGPFPAEGLVARPMVELKTRAGHRIITKLKTRDFATKTTAEQALASN